jgi:hypothetical protein
MTPQVAQYVRGIWAGLLFSVDHDVLSVRWTNDLPVILWFEERCGADENEDSVLIGLIGHFADTVPISFTVVETHASLEGPKPCCFGDLVVLTPVLAMANYPSGAKIL